MQASSSQASALALEPPPRRLRVLVVDDESDILSTIEHSFNLLLPDCDVATAPDGAAALDRIASFQPDVLVTDYRMPGLNGLELVAQVRARGLNPRVILVTAYGVAPIEQEAWEANVHLLGKPFDLMELVGLVEAGWGS